MFSTSGAVLRSDINALVSEAAKAEDFYIGTKVFPPLAVPERNGQYPKFKKANGELLNNDAELRAPNASYARIIRKYDSDSFVTQEYGLEEVVGDAEASDVNRFFDAEVAAANFVRRQLMLAHEIRVAAAVLNNTNFGTTGAATVYTTANKATADFAYDVLTAIDLLNSRGETPNTIVMSGPVFTRIKGQTLFQNFVRGNRPSDITANLSQGAVTEAFADAGISQVLVGRAAYNSAKKGLAFASAGAWSNTYVWIGRVEAGDMMTGGAGRTLYWNADSELFTSETYREESRRSTVVRVRQHTAEKIVDSESGTMITTGWTA
jgi:hypothetical protein